METELRAQVTTALRAGIDVTHLDAHMGTAWQPEFLDIYLRLGEEFALPVVLPRDVVSMAPAGFDFEPAWSRLAARGNPDFQRMLMTPFGNMAPTAADYAAIFAGAAPGLNFSGFHFTAPADFAMFSDDAPTRLAEYELFRSGEARAMLDAQGITLIGMRPLRDALRSRG